MVVAPTALDQMVCAWQWQQRMEKCSQGQIIPGIDSWAENLLSENQSPHSQVICIPTGRHGAAKTTQDLPLLQFCHRRHFRNPLPPGCSPVPKLFRLPDLYGDLDHHILTVRPLEAISGSVRVAGVVSRFRALESCNITASISYKIMYRTTAECDSWTALDSVLQNPTAFCKR